MDDYIFSLFFEIRQKIIIFFKYLYVNCADILRVISQSSAFQLTLYFYFKHLLLYLRATRSRVYHGSGYSSQTETGNLIHNSFKGKVILLLKFKMTQCHLNRQKKWFINKNFFSSRTLLKILVAVWQIGIKIKWYI